MSSFKPIVPVRYRRRCLVITVVPTAFVNEYMYALLLH